MAARGNGARDAGIDEHEEAGGDVASEAREVETFDCECVGMGMRHATAANGGDAEGERGLQVERRCF